MKTDHHWESFGQRDPYYGVAADDRFLSKNITDQAKAEFFQSGEKHVNFLIQTFQENFENPLRFSRALDFGCGVGRITLPLAKKYREVVGIDVSPAMLTEAHKNAHGQNISNIEFVRSDDQLSKLSGHFDLIHSHLVFQHIPIKRGEQLLEQLLDFLNPGGVAALHFTYGWEVGWGRRFIHWLQSHLPYFYCFVNLVRGRPFFHPFMQMNQYSLTRLTQILIEKGITKIKSDYQKHGPHLGVILFFQKPLPPEPS